MTPIPRRSRSDDGRASPGRRRHEPQAPHTTIPIAILCGMFNIRLGYSVGVRRDAEAFVAARHAAPGAVRAVPGDASPAPRHRRGRLWNVSDGGHFENMGAYQPVRRRLPVIVIVDAESDSGFRVPGSVGLRPEGAARFRRRGRVPDRTAARWHRAGNRGGAAPGGVRPTARASSSSPTSTSRPTKSSRARSSQAARGDIPATRPVGSTTDAFPCSRR